MIINSFFLFSILERKFLFLSAVILEVRLIVTFVNLFEGSWGLLLEDNPSRHRLEDALAVDGPVKRLFFLYFLLAWKSIIGPGFVVEAFHHRFLGGFSDQIQPILESIFFVCLVSFPTILSLLKAEFFRSFFFLFHKLLKFFTGLWKKSFYCGDRLTFGKSSIDLLAKVLQKIGLVILFVQSMEHRTISRLELAVGVG